MAKLSYKAKNKPADYNFTGRPYSNLDMVGTVVADGNLAMMSFRLVARNTGPLYGIPASGHTLQDWELGFAEFDGDVWVDAWWMADELGFLLAIGNDEALDFLGGE